MAAVKPLCYLLVLYTACVLRVSFCILYNCTVAVVIFKYRAGVVKINEL